MAIPKVIHFIWVGNSPKSKLIQKCIGTWAKYLPDFEIKEWNEENYDVNSNPYIQEAYRNRKWAFVADFIRFDVLYKYGGIYLDTDVELIKRIPDDILTLDAFTSFENDLYVNPGVIFACCSKNKIVGEVLRSFENEEYSNVEHPYTINVRLTDILRKYGLVQNNTYQVVEGIHVFPSEYFCAFNTVMREPEITDNTISVHHYAATWRSGKQKVVMILKTMIKKTVGKKLYFLMVQIKHKIKRETKNEKNQFESKKS